MEVMARREHGVRDMRLTRHFVGLLAIGALIAVPAQAMAQAKRPNPQEKAGQEARGRRAGLQGRARRIQPRKNTIPGARAPEQACQKIAHKQGGQRPQFHIETTALSRACTQARLNLSVSG
jgi:hypothetical protein